MRTIPPALPLAALLAALAACAPPERKPEAVAAAFWEAFAAGDLEGASKLSTAASVDELGALDFTPDITGVTTAPALLNESQALVGTSLDFAVVEAGGPVAFNTHLAHFDGGWRVQVPETARELRRAAIAASFAEVEESLRSGAKAVGDAVEEGLLKASEAIRESLEELERSLANPDANPPPRTP